MNHSPRSRLGGVRVRVLCLLAVALAACSSDKTAPTTTAPAGFTILSSAKGGYALAVPSEWTAIPLSLNPAVFDKDANRLRLANPNLASILNQARTLGQSGGLLMAVTPDGTGNVNLTSDKPKEKNLDQIVAASITGLQAEGATNLKQEPATLNDKPAVRLTFRIPVQTDAGIIPTDTVQHYLLERGKAFILTIAAVPTTVSAAIAASLRLS